MLNLNENCSLIESVSELPNYNGAVKFFCDIESQANTLGKIPKKHVGRYPFRGDRVCGLGFSWDDEPKAFYIPLRHREESFQMRNLPIEPVVRWLNDWLRQVRQWINHNIVFDASFFHFDGVEFACELVDTLTWAKMLDSDRMEYGLKELDRDWNNQKSPDLDRVKAWLKSVKSVDYSMVPIDILGEYCCNDVHRVKRLHSFLTEHFPSEMKPLHQTEINLTSVLYDMHMDGLRIDPLQCQIDQYECLKIIIQTSEEIETLTGHSWVNSHDCVYDVLIGQLGLPVLVTKKERDEDGMEIDTGRSTFDKDALALYAAHPLVVTDPDKLRLVKLILKYRKESQHNSLFLQSFLDLHDENGYVHPSYNQIVRTGRMSCRNPNSQQQNSRSKALILPHLGHGIISCDYSQIEFRLIAHYSDDLEVIAAYEADPWTDFHKLVAEILHIGRKRGKTLNFAMAYGAGKKKVCKGLSTDQEIVEEMGAVVRDMVQKGEVSEGGAAELFNTLCMEHATRSYQAYHERFDTIKLTSRKAAQIARMRGYVFNAYKRRRHLLQKFSSKAFNSIVQGCAMDVIKEAMVRMSPRFNKTSREIGLKLSHNVHDEVGSQVPVDAMRDPVVHNHIIGILENPSVQFKVPMRVGMGISERCWAEAAGDKQYKEKSTGRILGGSIRGEIKEIVEI